MESKTLVCAVCWRGGLGLERRIGRVDISPGGSVQVFFTQRRGNDSLPVTSGPAGGVDGRHVYVDGFTETDTGFEYRHKCQNGHRINVTHQGVEAEVAAQRYKRFVAV